MRRLSRMPGRARGKCRAGRVAREGVLRASGCFGRRIRRLYLSFLVFSLPGCAAVSVGQVADPADVSAVVPVEAEVACPSRNFRNFMTAYAESGALQKRFIRLPLTVRQVDVRLVGMGREVEATVTKSVRSYGEIQFVNTEDGDQLFPGARVRKKNGVKFSIRKWTGEHAGGMKAVLGTVEATGYNVHYIFVRSGTCWVLVEIDDRST
jgi:hypothetical protein